MHAPVALLWLSDVEEEEWFRDALGVGGFVSEVVRNEDELMSRALELRPAVVVVDLDLPAGVAWPGVERLNGNHETCEIPVIGVSQHDHVLHARRLWNGGFCGFLRKSVGAAALLAAVRYCLTRTADGMQWVDLSGF